MELGTNSEEVREGHLPSLIHIRMQPQAATVTRTTTAQPCGKPPMPAVSPLHTLEGDALLTR